MFEELRNSREKFSTYALKTLDGLGYIRDPLSNEKHPSQKVFYRHFHPHDDHELKVAKHDDKYIMVMNENEEPVPITNYPDWDKLLEKLIPGLPEKYQRYLDTVEEQQEHKRAKKATAAENVRINKQIRRRANAAAKAWQASNPNRLDVAPATTGNDTESDVEDEPTLVEAYPADESSAGMVMAFAYLVPGQFVQAPVEPAPAPAPAPAPIEPAPAQPAPAQPIELLSDDDDVVYVGTVFSRD